MPVRTAGEFLSVVSINNRFNLGTAVLTAFRYFSHPKNRLLSPKLQLFRNKYPNLLPEIVSFSTNFLCDNPFPPIILCH